MSYSPCIKPGFWPVLLAGLMYFALLGESQATTMCDAPPEPMTINISGSYSVPESDPINTLITPWVEVRNENYGLCAITTTSGVFQVAIRSNKLPGPLRISVDGATYPIYSTDLPGVGYIVASTSQLKFVKGGFNSGWEGWSVRPIDIAYSAFTYWSTGNTARHAEGLGVRVRLIKTGKIGGGIIPGFVVGTGAIGDSETWSQYNNIISVTSSVTVRAPSCTISTPTVQVTLDDILTTELKAVGSTAKSKAFDVKMNCNADTQINLTLQGSQNTDTSTDGVLNLTNAGTNGIAQGVGIQILYNNVPLAINTKTVVKTSSGGDETLTFNARYYQTRSIVTAGSANATATLNITYE